MPLLTTAQLRGRIETAITDDGLQAIIDACESEIVRRYGPHDTGLHNFHANPWGYNDIIVLPRAASEITSIHDRKIDGDTLIDADDYYMETPFIIARRSMTFWPLHAVVAYVPEDESAIRREVLVQLCLLSIHFSGFEYLKTPELTIQGSDYQVEREKVLRQLRRKPVLS